MVTTKYYATRKDGVDLFRTLDAVVDERGEPILDAEGEPIPTGFKIHKVGTDEFYDDAIDVAGAPFIYEETDTPIELVEEPAEVDA